MMGKTVGGGAEADGLEFGCVDDVLGVLNGADVGDYYA